MFRVKSLEKAEGRLNEVRRLFGADFKVLCCEQYWKIPELWDCRIETTEKESPMSDVVFETLRLADALANGWHVTGPSVYENRLGMFSGVFNAKPKAGAYLAGLDWASFSVDAVRS